MNESVNDEAVCRTAPATPGLLNKGCVSYQRIHDVLFAAIEKNMFLCTEILREQLAKFYPKTLNAPINLNS